MDHDWNLGKGKMNDGDRSTVDALHRLLLTFWPFCHSSKRY